MHNYAKKLRLRFLTGNPRGLKKKKKNELMSKTLRPPARSSRNEWLKLASKPTPPRKQQAAGWDTVQAAGGTMSLQLARWPAADWLQARRVGRLPLRPFFSSRSFTIGRTNSTSVDVFMTGGANLPAVLNATNYQWKLKRRHCAKTSGGIDLFLFCALNRKMMNVRVGGRL